MGPNRPFFQGRQLGPEAQFTRNKSSSVNPTRRAEFTFKRLSSVPLTTEIPTFWLSFFFGLFLCEQCCAVLCCEHCSQRKRPKKKESQNVGINTCIHDQMARSKWLFWCQALSIFAAATFFWACLSFGISLISFLGIPKCFSTVALTPAAPSLSQRLWTDLEGDFLHLPSFLPCDRLWHKLNLECNECI